MAKSSKFTHLIIWFVFGCTPMLNAQLLELNAPEEKLPSPTEVDSTRKDLDLSEVDLDRLFEFPSEATPKVEKASHTAETEKVPANPLEEVAKKVRESTPEELAADKKADQPVNTKTREVQMRELDGEPVTRGPIHEAFAEPFAMLPESTKVIPQAPPALVEEIPPTQPPKSSGNMEWISGYWAWDTQSKEYIWISGVWRKKPKDRVWLPGRWEAVDGGHQWIAGAWMPTDGGQVVKKEVLPLPPKSLEQGPASPAPSEEHFWVPGVWQRNNSTYAWRTGYWSRSQKNWVWVPDHYTSVAGGCVFVPGYWDYTWERRGTLYAPCSFGVNTGDHICYRPTKVIDTNQWLTNLWVAPRTGHYHFGDYHDCAVNGYQPWYQYYGSNRSYYDPFYTYYRWQFPATYGVGMYGYLNSLHRYYGSHAAHRPRVSLYGYDTWARRGRGYSSFGDVYTLARLAGINLDSRYRNDYRDHLHDYYRDRNRDYRDRDYRDRDYRDRDNRRRYNDYDYGYRRSPDTNRSRPKQPERRLLGYANGAPLYSDQRTGGVKRAEIGVPRSRNFDSPSQRKNTSRPKSRSDIQMEVRGPVRQVLPKTNPRSPAVSTPRPRPRPVSRPNTFAENNSKHAPRQVTRSSPPQVNRPNATRVSPNRPTVQSRPQPRAKPRVQPRVQPKPQPKAQPRPNVTRKQPVRPKVTQSRPAPAARKPSGPGFSISGMKNSRNKADVTRQRAAMQKHIQQRKGR